MVERFIKFRVCFVFRVSGSGSRALGPVVWDVAGRADSFPLSHGRERCSQARLPVSILPSRPHVSPSSCFSTTNIVQEAYIPRTRERASNWIFPFRVLEFRGLRV